MLREASEPRRHRDDPTNKHTDINVLYRKRALCVYLSPLQVLYIKNAIRTHYLAAVLAPPPPAFMNFIAPSGLTSFPFGNNTFAPLLFASSITFT